MPDLPTRFATLIITFAPLFVQRSWLHARVLLVGAILAPGRRTVASVLRIAGHARNRHFTNYHRVLSRSPWSARGGEEPASCSGTWCGLSRREAR